MVHILEKLVEISHLGRRQELRVGEAERSETGPMAPSLSYGGTKATPALNLLTAAVKSVMQTMIRVPQEVDFVIVLQHFTCS